MSEILEWSLGLLATIITGIITTVVLPTVVKWLNSKITNTNLRTVMEELGETVASSVNYINQTFVDQLKADGKWDVRSEMQAMKLCVCEVMKDLSKQTKQILNKDGVDIEQIIVRRIEDEIYRRNQRSR